MAKQAGEGTTIRQKNPRVPRVAPAPWLSILWHPTSDRIGDVAPLPARLSRLEPELGPPGLAPRSPLGDPHLSRKPILLDGKAGTLRITADASAELVVDGSPVAGSIELPAGALARGVVLELAERVVLWLQLRQAPIAEPSDQLVGASDAIVQLRERIARVAPLAIPVLVTGETGAGKEHVARAIHAGSSRANGPFVAVNMATIAPSVAAAQLFGHERGAFTGADRAHVGLFERAHGGTLFLDEIADAPPEVQAMMLRALETGEIQPVGSQDARRVDTRVVAATDADLESELATGEVSEPSRASQFRTQLYHRLAGSRIAVPPLRDRIDDLGRLLAGFIARELAAAGARDRIAAAAPGDPPWLPSAAVRAYARHGWPGNVRELANLARHLAVVGRDGPISVEDAVAPLGRAARAGDDVIGLERDPVTDLPAPPPRTIDDDRLIATLAAQRWKTGATAAALGISRTTLYGLIDRCPRIRKARDLDRAEIVGCHEAANGDLDVMSERLQVSKRGLQLRMRELGL